VKIKLVKLHKREHKSEPFLRVNKFGQVPALVERRKGQVKFMLSESSAILKYLSEKYSLLVSESKMYSNDLRAKAKIWSALDWYQTTIRSSAAGVSWHAYVAGNMGGKVSLELAKHYEERLKMSLDVLETLRLGDKYPFLNEREHPSIADLLVIEDIVNLVVLKGSPFREELSSLDQLLAERPRVRKWRDAVMRINKPIFNGLAFSERDEKRRKRNVYFLVPKCRGRQSIKLRIRFEPQGYGLNAQLGRTFQKNFFQKRTRMKVENLRP